MKTKTTFIFLFQKYSASIYTFLISFFLLSFVQVKLSNPIILLERFVNNGGWIEIIALSLFGAFLATKMMDISKVQKWRTISWTIFSIVFFSQLFMGVLGYERFLMTGTLHLPIPAMIAGGAIYRLELSFMPILFISTIMLTGPAWCSQLCYFGAFDNLTSGIKSKKPTFLKHVMMTKNLILIIFVGTAIVLRTFNVPILQVTLFAVIFGIVGVLIVAISSFHGKMVHCIYYCPIGTLVSYLKYINPFRMYIDDTCTNCNRCTKTCKYQALERVDILNRKPGFTCTYCGDCLTSCHMGSIKYKFLGLSPENSRKAYIIITISVYIIFLGLARM